ncbi:hypothetical protein BT96DRAFT_941464 [Gymnopus androsaceus JB14]|uniref:Uncharacterized protein n=1 Tax=Gymnopus androsaceus JB14 TaxID=1447944 RepID=A0A6A4HG83_9AGAR|nr:hypothetical protein BT96DRAFT_941464 [Gymnopus androsaceus JB14]
MYNGITVGPIIPRSYINHIDPGPGASYKVIRLERRVGDGGYIVFTPNPDNEQVTWVQSILFSVYHCAKLFPYTGGQKGRVLLYVKYGDGPGDTRFDAYKTHNPAVLLKDNEVKAKGKGKELENVIFKSPKIAAINCKSRVLEWHLIALGTDPKKAVERAQKLRTDIFTPFDAVKLDDATKFKEYVDKAIAAIEEASK